jgi:hypothetical protein
LLAHLGNLSYRVGRTLNFDAEKLAITGDVEATALMKRSGRGPFQIPDKV